MTLCKWYIKICHKSMNKIVTSSNKLKRCCEWTVSWRHFWDVHGLNKDEQVSTNTNLSNSNKKLLPQMKRKIHRCRHYCMKHTMQGTLNIKASSDLILLTLSSWQFVAIWFWSTVSTRGSIKACFLMQLMSNPYTLFQTDMENGNIINKKIKYTWWHKYHLCD